MAKATISEPTPNELTLGTVGNAIKARWYFPVATVAMAIVIALIFLHTASPVYRATMIVSPIFNEDSEAGGGLSDLASTIGIDIGGKGSLTYFSLFMETLQSYELAERLGRDSDLLPTLYPALWDAERQRWRDPDSVRSPLVRLLRKILNRPATSEPNLADLHQYLRRGLTVEDPPTPFKTISYENIDPNYAETFLMSVYTETDDLVRTKVKQRASAEASYLRNLIERSTVAEHRLALSNLLAQKQRLLMMAGIDQPFSAQLLQPPISANDPASPRPMLVLTMSIFFGLIIGVFLALALPRNMSFSKKTE